ncbi:hypothetical protein PM082_009965 [Marasmius tenuissimus]|nr:hypothetical protein PM082_009965 [Marasmius tenuissimus]
MATEIEMIRIQITQVTLLLEKIQANQERQQIDLREMSRDGSTLLEPPSRTALGIPAFEACTPQIWPGTPGQEGCNLHMPVVQESQHHDDSSFWPVEINSHLQLQSPSPFCIGLESSIKRTWGDHQHPLSDNTAEPFTPEYQTIVDNPQGGMVSQKQRELDHDLVPRLDEEEPSADYGYQAIMNHTAETVHDADSIESCSNPEAEGNPLDFPLSDLSTGIQKHYDFGPHPLDSAFNGPPDRSLYSGFPSLSQSEGHHELHNPMTVD